MRGCRGYARFVRQLMDEPSTHKEMVERFGLGLSSARRMSRGLLDLGVLSVIEWRRENSKGPAMRVYAVCEPRISQETPTLSGAPSRHCGAKPRSAFVGIEKVAFASVWEATTAPCSVAELMVETGICNRTLMVLLAEMHSLGLVGIADWTQTNGRGPFIPQYMRGLKRDKPKPSRLSNTETSRRYRTKKAWRYDLLLAA